MAGRVNVKFVIALSVGAVVLLGVAGGLALTVVLKSGEDYATLAAQQEEDGNIEAAAESWSRAVSHDRDNIEWLESWLEVQQQIIPETRVEYEKHFNDRYMNVLLRIADVKKTDVDAHERPLIEQETLFRSGGFNRNTEESIARSTEQIIGVLEVAGAPEGWERIRKHRGIAILRMMSSGSRVDSDQVELALADLEAALEATPDDGEIAVALSDWHLIRSGEAQRDGRDDEAAALLAAGNGLLEAFAAAHPGELEARIRLVRSRVSGESERLARIADPLERADAERELTESVRPDVEALFEEAMEMDAEQLTANNVNALATMLNVIDGIENDRAITLWDRAVEVSPTDYDLLMGRAMMLRTRREYDEAMAQYREVLDLPVPPVSARGMRLLLSIQPAAQFELASTAVDAWQNAPEDQKEETLQVATGERDNMAEEFTETDPRMLLLDSRIAIAKEDLDEADRKLREFNQATQNTNPLGMRLAGDVSQRKGNLGAARTSLERAVELQPNNLQSILLLANVYGQLRELDRQIAMLSAATLLAPDNEAIRTQLELITRIAEGGEGDDPIENILINTQRLLNDGSVVEAREALEEGLAENPDEIRLIESVAQIAARQNDLEAAKRFADRGLAIDPENVSLKRISDLAGTDDPILAVAREIENSDLPEGVKRARMADVFRRAGRDDEASEQIDLALSADPDNPRAIALAFQRALDSGDVMKAREYEQRAAQLDLDGSGGRTFTARRQRAEGEIDAAETTLLQAIQLGSTNADAWRVLGEVQLERGARPQALESFRQSLAIRPGDMITLVQYMGALTQSGRAEDALQVARDSLAIARSDARFASAWLDLEGQVGNKELALTERYEIEQRRPDDRRNKRQIIGLLIDTGNLDDARARIDAERDTEDSLQLVRLDARWHAAQNNLDAARNVYVDYIIGLGTDLDNPGPYINYGQFLIEQRDYDRGLAALRQARRYQDPESPIADAVLAAQLFDLGRFGEAVEIYEGLLNSPIASEQVRLRLAETLLRLNRFDEAAVVIDEVSEEQRDSLTVRLLRSDIFKGNGDIAAAETELDEAVAAYQDAALPYIKRAQLLAGTPDGSSDAIEDLTEALRIEPTNTAALRIRASLYYESERVNQAVDDLAAAVASNPDDTELRVAAMSQFISMDRDTLATELADQGIERRPTDLALIVSSGDVFARDGQHRQATTYFARAWALAKNQGIARRYINSLLEARNPDVSTARQIVLDPALDREEDAAVILLEARIEKARNNDRAARELAEKAFDLLSANPQTISAWVRELETVFGTTEEAVEFLDQFQQDNDIGQSGRLRRAQLLASNEPTRDRGIDGYTALLAEDSSDSVRSAVIRFRSIAYYDAERYEEAAQDMRAALEINPDDGETLNNLAFTLTAKLNRAEEAVPLAERARELMPTSPNALDTLGLSYLRSGRAADAIEPLEEAEKLQQNDSDRVSVLMHLSEAVLEQGDVNRADELAEEARGVLRDLDDPDADVEDQLADLRDRISRAR